MQKLTLQKLTGTGQLPRRLDGKPYEIIDSLGDQIYTSIKGDFYWERNAIPEYYWFNGTADHHFLTDTVCMDDIPLKINTLFGSYNDEESKIIPVKVHRGNNLMTLFTVPSFNLSFGTKKRTRVLCGLTWIGKLR